MAEHVATQFQDVGWFEDSRDNLLDEAARAGWPLVAQRIITARINTREQLEFPISNVIKEQLLAQQVRDGTG